jgi:DNA modification methylase
MEAKILIGDVRTRMSQIPNGSVQCVVTSPPYWGLRDYGCDGQIGLEQTPQEYVAEMVSVFREVWRVMSDDGVLWLNIGDSYKPSGSTGSTKKGFNKRYFGEHLVDGKQAAEENHLDRSAFRADGIKPKDLVGIPWRLAFALQDDGWYLRQDIIWAKPNPMPESVRDRCTKSHEYIFMLTKSSRYFFDNEAIKEEAKTPPTVRNKNAEGYQADYPNGDRFSKGERVFGADGKRNKRDVWIISTKPFKGAHFAVMPEAIVEPCVLASSRPGDTVFDPFTGSGTVGVVALRHKRNFLGTELNPEYGEIARTRIETLSPLENNVELLKEANY